MSNPHSDTTQKVDAAIAARAMSPTDTLWRDARSAGLHRMDILWAAIALCALATLFVGRDYAAVMAFTASIAVVSLAAERASRQFKAICALLERLKADRPRVT